VSQAGVPAFQRKKEPNSSENARAAVKTEIRRKLLISGEKLA
jgi:hypothetical protein